MERHVTASATTDANDATIARLMDEAHQRWIARRTRTRTARQDHAAWSKNGLPGTYDIDDEDVSAIKSATIPNFTPPQE
jgi:hypothetical protein